MAKIENYVFDLYGTLVDIRTNSKEPRIWKMLADYFCRYGICYDGKQLFNEVIRIDTRMRKEAALRQRTLYPEIRVEDVFYELIREHRSFTTEMSVTEKAWGEMTVTMFRALSMRMLRLFPSTLRVLERLKKEGKKIYLLSNAQRVFTMPEIRMLGLSEAFDRIIISSDYGFCKPDSRILNLLLEEEHLDPAKTVMVGNEPETDMALAAFCGTQAILYNSGMLSRQEIERRIMKTAEDNGFPEEKMRQFLKKMKIMEVPYGLSDNQR